MELLSQNLRQFRLAGKLTQEQAAEKLGVNAQTVSRWECGTTLPDVTKLPQIAELYGVTIDDLFRKSSIAYENYAQRLAAVYEATKRPEDYLRALHEFEKLEKSNNLSSMDCFEYGVLHQMMMQDCRQKALHWLEQAITESIGSDPYVFRRAGVQRMKILIQEGQRDQVVAAQRQLACQKPQDSSVWCLLLASLHLTERYQEAYDCYRQIAAQFPEDWELHTHGGTVCRELGLYEEAFSCWDHALDLAPDQIDVKYEKAFCHLSLGQNAEAKALFLEIAQDWQKDGFDVEAEAEFQRANAL